MKMKFLIILGLILLSGCAGPEKKVEENIVFYPALPQKPRLQFLSSIASETDIGKKPSAFREFIVGKTESLKKIERPYDIGAVKGKIYISDRTLKKIIIVDLINKEFDLIKDSKEGALSEPAGIWVTEDDFKYVADMERKQIVVYDYDNKFLRAYGEKDQFSKPFDVAVYGNRIYVCDFARHQIAVVNKDSGKTIETIGRPGSNDGEFANPTHVIVDKEGNVYVNDSFNFRVQKFNPQGEFIKKFGYHGDTAGGFARPKGIAFDDEGHLYVVDTASEYTQIFDDNTTDVLLPFGGFGANGEGPGDMYLPNGIYIDNQNMDYFSRYVDKDFRLKYLVYVGNMLGIRKLSIYGFGEWKGAALPDIEKK